MKRNIRLPLPSLLRITLVAVAAPLLGAATIPAVAAVAVAAPAGPTATLRSYNERLDKLLRKKSDSPVDRQAIKSLANELFDYRELARRALAQHWDKLTKAQQDEFTRTLAEMMERNYVKQLRSNLDYEVAYRDESIAGTGDEATVSSVVKVRTRGKSTDVSIDYKMRRAPDGKWLVWDVITDEVSMVRNYRQQFNKIITTESYDALLAKMKKRIKDSEAERPSTTQ